MKSDARPDQLIAFTRRLHEARPIKDRDLPPAALNQTSTLQLSGGIRDGWPLDTQHFGEQVLNNSRVTADIVSELRTLKRRTEKAIYIFGSGMRSLLPEGVVDEIRLALVPVLLGQGTRLFGEGPQVPLRLVSSQPVPNGTMLLNCAVGVA